MPGLLQVKSNAELDKEAQSAIDSKLKAEQPTESISALSAHIQHAWDQNKRAKHSVEKRLLMCLRARNGEYDAATKSEIDSMGGSDIYMLLTATKIRAATSWVRDIILPSNSDRPWGLSPTPIPNLPPTVLASIRDRLIAEIEQELMGAEQQGRAIEPDVMKQQVMQRAALIMEDVKKEADKQAQVACDKMELRIDDQLKEGGFNSALEQFVDDFSTFPTAFIKGPIYRKKKRLKWGNDHQPIVEDEVIPEFERVSPFDLYPSPYAESIDDGELIELIRFSPKTLYGLIGVEGYSETNIRQVLDNFGREGFHTHLWTDTERAELEGQGTLSRQDERTIEALHYWGTAQGQVLLEWGIDPELVDDPVGEYDIEAIKIGPYVIRAQINQNPLGQRPYQGASFQNTPGSIWGVGIPELMEDIQRVCNATARALINNLAISSGPQVMVLADMIAEGADVTEMYPWKIWQMRSNPMGGGAQNPIQFFQPSSNANELLSVFKEFELRADDATNIPRYTYGNSSVSGAGRTASGLSMLMETTGKGIKTAIAHIDVNLIRPLLTKLYNDNMMYDSDPDIKMDAQVVAKGTTALIAKDQAQARRMEMLQITGNDLDMQILGVEGRAKILRDLFKHMDMEDFIPSEEEVIKKLKEQQQAQASQVSEQELKQAELELKAKAIESDNALKAKDIDTDARLKARELELRREIALIQNERRAKD
ncbi:hypothetical protein [Pleionea sp. CnH1-48]|uniref:portal protein n=1 Tax=Pleionea sp. CnH1-48 TaxID=2954494 RepID=UPI0020970FB0|nr:hypothetical protein [Pleionea sp. CnH1-48]MCO7225922.1 hypothetical protein [Pleionea sp. CnH1-48]